MEENPTFTHNMDVLFSNLEEFTKKEAILGKPVTHGDKTLIPVMSVMIGYGHGNGSNKNQQGSTTANQGTNMGMGALGLGARISTDAIVVIDKDNVSMLPTSEKSNLTAMMEKVPQMLTNIVTGGQQQGQQAQQPGQQAQQNQP